MDVIGQYKSLKDKISRRTQPFGEFLCFLENKTSWLTSPASTRFHLCMEGGLLKHSVGVANTLLTLKQTLAPQISEESCVITGLFHDVGKIGMPDKPLYIPNSNEWEVKKKGICYRTNPETIVMGLAARSLYLVSKFIPLSDAEAQAILYHDGQYIEENRIVAHREEPLTLLLHWADYWTAHIFEEGRALVEDMNCFDRC
ncbi:MAG TPA: HD domain-containing protein [Syntrophobacter fumaroxidans]|nr:HD domain-containing protein [Syntrophobacter fumaroxidans]